MNYFSTMLCGVLVVVSSICSGCATLSTEDTINEDWGTVVPDSLYVRAGPSMKHQEIGIIRSGEIVRIIDHLGHWVQIEFSPHKTAYVGSKHIAQARTEAAAFKSPINLGLVDDTTSLESGYTWWLIPISILAKMSEMEIAALTLATETWTRHGNKMIRFIKSNVYVDLQSKKAL